VTRLDRLARSTRDLLNTLATITSKGAGFRSLHDMGGHDDRARSPNAHRARRAGRVRARIYPHPHRRRPHPPVAQGVRMGRKPKLTDHQRREAIKHRDHPSAPRCCTWRQNPPLIAQSQ
jgi:DNA invertase Pin-like site-specific DNA recombinase